RERAATYWPRPRARAPEDRTRVVAIVYEPSAAIALARTYATPRDGVAEGPSRSYTRQSVGYQATMQSTTIHRGTLQLACRNCMRSQNSCSHANVPSACWRAQLVDLHGVAWILASAPAPPGVPWRLSRTSHGVDAAASWTRRWM